MAKFHVGDLVIIKSKNEQGKIIAIDKKNPKLYVVEIIVAFDKEKGERTTKLIDVKENDLKLLKVKRKRNKKGQKDVVYWAKVKPNAIIPSKRLEDGCYDVYACVDEDEITIHPHEIVEISTGIASAFSPKYRLDFQRERGSTGSFGLVPRCGQIDSGYRGEIFLKMQNTTNKTIVISKHVQQIQEFPNKVIYPMNKAICQAALEFVPDVYEKEIPYEQLIKIPSKRGTGKLGSTGK